VLAEGQVGQNQYDNSDTSEAMAITLTQVKLHKLIEKYVPDDKREQATGIVDEMIDGKVAFREERTRLGHSRCWISRTNMAPVKSWRMHVIILTS